MKAWATVSAVMSKIGMASGHLVNQLIQVSKWTYPLEGGGGPTMLMCILVNLTLGVLNISSSAVVWCRILRRFPTLYATSSLIMYIFIDIWSVISWWDEGMSGTNAWVCFFIYYLLFVKMEVHFYLEKNCFTKTEAAGLFRWPCNISGGKL